MIADLSTAPKPSQYDKATGRLSYDPDGTGSASAVKFAQVKKGLALKSTDFFVI
jgi:hypothetical protein